MTFLQLQAYGWAMFVAKLALDGNLHTAGWVATIVAVAAFVFSAVKAWWDNPR